MDVAVADHGDPATAADGDVDILLGVGDGNFTPAKSFPAGKNPISIAVGDLDGDSKPDLVFANLGDRPSGGSGNLSVLLGNGDGSFQTPVGFTAGSQPFALAVGDFNGDHKLDVAVSDFGRGNASDPGGVWLLLGNGDGTLNAPTLFVAGIGPAGVATADFNGDGSLDLAVVDQHDPSSTTHGGMSILLGRGDGNFQAPSFFPMAAFPTALTVADFNGDAKLDLLATSYIAVLGVKRGALSLASGHGDGSFSTPAAIARGEAFPLAPVVTDFDQDGHLDVAEILGTSISVFRGKGDGTTQGRLIFLAGAGNFAMASNDFNGDGKPDLVVANQAGNDVTVFTNAIGR
jgi:FG-GAP-like repeat/FG-GAP repeat